MPITITSTNGSVARLQRFQGNRPVYLTSDNNNAAETISTDEIWGVGTNGYTLTGSNIIFGMWDVGGVLASHWAFATGRTTHKQGPAVALEHSTRVAGIMIACGTLVDIMPCRGMAYEGQVYVYDSGNSMSELASAISTYDLKLSNHSYGDYRGWDYNADAWRWYGDPDVSETEDIDFGKYVLESRAVDVVVFEAVYHLPVFSAGNDRTDPPRLSPSGTGPTQTLA